MKKLLFVLLITVSSVIHAQWIFYGVALDGSELFIDKNTIQQVGKYKRAWTKVESSSNSELTKINIRSTRQLEEIDCYEKKVRFLSFTTFRQANLIERVNSIDETKEWKFIAPGTNGETFWEIVCKTK
jgi:hypothetical protein